MGGSGSRFHICSRSRFQPHHESEKGPSLYHHKSQGVGGFNGGDHGTKVQAMRAFEDLTSRTSNNCRGEFIVPLTGADGGPQDNGSEHYYCLDSPARRCQ